MGNTDGIPLNATVLTALYPTLSHPGTFACLSSTVYDPTRLPHSTLIPVHHFIAPTVLSTRYPSLPSLLRCNGKEYPVTIFGGCPGYLAPFIKLLEATSEIKKNRANPDMQRTVEFYGSAVEDLLERLSQMTWED
eukprot:TRINITY_DN48471_c0_g1_i1.p1 TRINITY_DN48471_c0_g1~~TRINITY_DN48471_c0_g1_i1.p1  ORF type:complete len:155 (+),score=17.25 TRINITY_DN48471_c0_g1_i1:61-465(+)